MSCPPTGRVALACAALLALAATARAADTAPILSLSAAEALRGNAGILVRVDGSYPLDDMVQTPMAVQLLIRELDGNDFVRFELSTGAFEGNLESLATGLDAVNVFELLALTEPSPGARLMALRPGRIEVLLPSDFPAGPAEAQLFFLYNGDPVFSNPIGLTLPGMTP
jgi:hypothetical protein